jgi:hypothetical protein
MKPFILSIAACAMAAALSASASAGPCDHVANAEPMRGRVQTLELQVERLERSTDPEERRSLAETNMKRVREALGELRHRELPADCRVEMMNAMIHAMVRNEQAMLAGSPE